MNSIATLSFTALTACAAVGCDRMTPVDTTRTTAANVQPEVAADPNPDPRPGMSPEPNARAEDVADPASARPLRATDPGSDVDDMNTTAAVRKAIFSSDTLSADAKNITIITSEGAVTLRGTLKTVAEKSQVEFAAKSAAGNHIVVDELAIGNK